MKRSFPRINAGAAQDAVLRYFQTELSKLAAK